MTEDLALFLLSFDVLRLRRPSRCIRTQSSNVKPPRRVLGFGAASGLIWSIFPAALREVRSPKEAATYLIAGVLVGILASLALASVLKRSGRPAAILLGALSLPLAAFLFGVVLTMVQWLIREATGTAIGFAAYPFAPASVGVQLFVYASISIFSPILYPLAVGTTLLLRRFVGQNSS
jgi:hypothetical protein